MAAISQQNGTQGHYYEESFDDHMLPDAVELGKLKDLDPEIIEWIKKRTEEE